MIWMWDAVYGGLEPQPWHYNITWAQPYPIFPKIHPDLQRRNSVRVHPYAHPQHLKVLNTLYTYDMDVGCSPWVFGASTMTLQHHSGSALPQLSENPSLTYRRNSVRVYPYAHPQHIKALNTLYTYDMDVGCSLWGFGASTMILQHPRAQLYPNFPKIHPWPAQA